MRQEKHTTSPIEEQVILPLPVAIRITLRGLKIRLGRSLITMSGVVLGIAFLMSVLTGEGLRSGLEHETKTKTEVSRLLSLIEDEIGTFQGRKISILVNGPVEGKHLRRVLAGMAAEMGEGKLYVFQTEADELKSRTTEPFPEFRDPVFVYTADRNEFFSDSHLLLLLDERLPPLDDATLKRCLEKMRQAVVLDYFFGRYTEEHLAKLTDKAVYGSLSYRKTEEEIRKDLKKRHQQNARRIWITVVSMLVTVIGISNAMLMSVTERIREIGTMKCLGALSGFVVKLFLIESLIIGVLGAIIGTVVGFLVPLVAYMLSAGAALLLSSTPFGTLAICGLGATFVGTILAILAAIYPARVAAKMVPADALRTNV